MENGLGLLFQDKAAAYFLQHVEHRGAVVHGLN